MADSPYYSQDDALAQLRQFLLDNELPLTLLDFIRHQLANNTPFDQIVAELRNTPEYKAAYPENDLRKQNGFDWWSEAQIRAYRSTARQISMQYLGYNPTNEQISAAIGKNRGLDELAHRFQVYKDFQRWGPTVQNALEQELGHKLDDQRLFEFFDGDVSTPELDRAYELALLRGMPAQLGLGMRPEQEAELLRQHGIDPNTAFAAYGQIAGELPMVERFAAIDAYIQDNGTKFPDPKDALGDSSFGLLFRAVQLNDPEAKRRLQQTIARETARFQAGGGAAVRGTAAIGLLNPEERRVG